MFGLFGGKKKTVESKKLPELSSAVKGAISEAVGVRSIPAMPAAAQKAFGLATDPKADAQDFISVIEVDEALSARVLKIANSVYFERGKKSTTVDEAVVVIGINELRCLLNANTLSEIFPTKHMARSQLWGNDIATALISKTLAQRLLPGKVEFAFMGGLMHDIGKLLLLQRNSGEYAKVLKRVESEGLSFCEAEEKSFPFDHTEVGQLIGERWSFSSDLIEVIRQHHRPWRDTPSSSMVELSTLVGAANVIAHSLGLGLPGSFGRLINRATSELEQVWEVLRVPAHERKQILSSCKQNYEMEYDLYSGNFFKQ